MTYCCSCVHDDLCGRCALGRSRHQKERLQIEAEIGHDDERGMINDADTRMIGVMSLRLTGAWSFAFVNTVLSSYRLAFEGLGTAGRGFARSVEETRSENTKGWCLWMPLSITSKLFLIPFRTPSDTTGSPSEVTDCDHGCNNRWAGFNRHCSRAFRNGSSGNRSHRSTIDSEQVALCASRSSPGSSDCERSGEQLERRHQPLARMSGSGRKREGDLHGAREFHVCMFSSRCADRSLTRRLELPRIL